MKGRPGPVARRRLPRSSPPARCVRRPAAAALRRAAGIVALAGSASRGGWPLPATGARARRLPHAMDNPFFSRPILNPAHAYPARRPGERQKRRPTPAIATRHHDRHHM